jgi:hypothetical protein
MRITRSPRGNLSSISKNLKRLARYGNTAGLRAYICGDFLAAFLGLDPERRHSAMLVYARAVSECEARAKLPLAAPVALNARTFSKLTHRNPGKLQQLADAYARGEDHEGAARLLGVTIGAARLARRRYLRLPIDTGAKRP